MPQTEQQTREEWLAGLKVGDEVAIPVNYGLDHHISKVTSTTRTLVRIGSAEYSRRNGYRRGPKTGWGVRQRLEPPSREIRSQVKHQQLLDEFLRLADRRNSYSTATLEAAIAVLKGEANAD